jgi:3-oxo-4-pregnene-20-carboxyl-CoA dehydrogenase alpha subunit
MIGQYSLGCLVRCGLVRNAPCPQCTAADARVDDKAGPGLNTELSDEAAEFGRLALRVLGDAGGNDLAPAAARDHQQAGSLVAWALGEIGTWQLDPRGDPAELEAAAAVSRSAGYWAAPYPVAARLARPAGLSADALAVVPGAAVPGAGPAVPGGHGLRWSVVDLRGRRSLVSVRKLPGRSQDPSVPDLSTLELSPADDDGMGDVPLALLLPCWTLLGLLDRAIELTTAHVLSREQFGRPLAAFQGVRFQLTEAEVERAGTEALANYALWSFQERRADMLADALALRLAAVEAADVVFQVAHQLHGAIGFCDESPLSWLSRASKPLRHLPFGRSGTLDQLARLAGRRGLAGVFSEEAPAASHGGEAGPAAALPPQGQPLTGTVRRAEPAV